MIDLKTYQHVVTAWKSRYHVEADGFAKKATTCVEADDIEGFRELLANSGDIMDPAWDLAEILYNVGQPQNIGGVTHFSDNLSILLDEYGLRERVGGLGHCYVVWVVDPDYETTDDDNVVIPEGCPGRPVFVAIESSAADGETARATMRNLSEMEQRLFASLTLRAMTESGAPEWAIREVGEPSSGPYRQSLGSNRGTMADKFNEAIVAHVETTDAAVQELRESLLSWQGNIPEGGETNDG